MVSLRGFSAAALLALAMGVNATQECSSAQICGDVIPDSSGDDVYVQITAPVAAGWAGFGFGSRMRGALIFVIYSSADGKNVTLSPRIGTGNVEPQYESSIKVEVLEGTGIEDEKWIMNFVCHNCREWDGGSLDVTSDDELFIFARGGGDAVSSDEPDAGIYQHITRGNINIDLAGAALAVQSNPFLDDNSNSDGGNNTDTSKDDTSKDDTSNDNTKSDDTKSNDSGNGGSSAPMTKADKTLLAHGMAFIIASGFITSLLL